MCKWYNEMDCYILLPTEPQNSFNTDKINRRQLLESSFRNYAAVFDKVKIVIPDSQAKDHYLNFPHICNPQQTSSHPDLSAIFYNATSDAIFIGHADMVDFPISLLTNLVKSYNGELFLGYDSNKSQKKNIQFGIYNKSLIAKTSQPALSNSKARTLIPIPTQLQHFSF